MKYKVCSHNSPDMKPERSEEIKYSQGPDFNLGMRNRKGTAYRDDSNSFSEKEMAATGLNLRKPL